MVEIKGVNHTRVPNIVDELTTPEYEGEVDNANKYGTK